jgi:DNA invertase Pin-like site-specific DNA recombinase
MASLLGVFAEFELKIPREHLKAGIAQPRPGGKLIAP